jgi:hypothetical protein
MHNRKINKIFIVTIVLFTYICFFHYNKASAAAFTEFSIRPSRIEVSITDVNFLIKANAITTATEDAIRVTFQTGYTVDATPANITVTTTGVATWDAECANAWPGIGTAATAVNGQVVDFASTDLTAAQVYCFIITAGIDNPGSTGNYSITVATRATSADVDTGALILPIVDDDEIVINADVGAFVRCDVTTTTGSDNTSDLGTLTYGTVSSSSDDIQIQGGTNTAEGMVWYYRSDASNNGLYSSTATDLLDGSSAERTISATTADCAATTPCYGIYFNGTSSAGTGTFTADADFDGGTVTTDVGTMRIDIYGEAIGNSTSAACSNVTANYNINATAAENTVLASDYTDTLIFTCKADI